MANGMYENGVIDATLLELLRDERKKALSHREWKFRLAGFGYGIKEDGERKIVTRLLNGTELGLLPVNFH
ncbi:hypothetical protein [Pseudooceanicola lipolyticus]|nr:hypothetical protein [Pseudooceanicola lipolyticus]